MHVTKFNLHVIKTFVHATKTFENVIEKIQAILTYNHKLSICVKIKKFDHMGAKFLTRDTQRNISKILPLLNSNFDKNLNKIKLDTEIFKK